MSGMTSSNVWDSNKPDIDDFLIDDSDDDQGFIQPDQAIESDVPGTSRSSAPAATSNTNTQQQQQAPPPAYSLDSRFTAATGGQIEQRRFMGGDTLDEPVTATLMRDIRSVGFRLRQVVWYTPASSLQASHPGFVPTALSSSQLDAQSHRVDQEWDMWGPLVFCLIISLTMSMIAPKQQTSLVFSGLFVLIWAGQAVVALNIKLLGGTISFFHAFSVIGYCLFPVVPAALLAAFVNLFLVRIIVDVLLIIWAIYAATKGLQDSGVLPSRVFLATFPVGLFYTCLGWLCVIT